MATEVNFLGSEGISVVFNLSYDVAALVFLLIICWQFFSQRQFPLLSNHVFALFLLLAVLALVMDIGGTLMLNPELGTPLWLCYVVNALYYMVLILFPSVLTVYILARSDNTNPRDYLTALTPSLLSELVFLFALPFGLVFRISPAMVYSHGPFSPITYVNLLVNLLFGIWMLLRCRKNLPQQELLSLSVSILFVVAAAVFQFLYPDTLLVCAGIAAALTLMFFTIQNPGRMLDEISHLFNLTALRIYLRSLLVGRRTFHLAAVKLHSLHRINTVYGVDVTNRLLRDFGRNLVSRPQIWAFRIGGSRFVVLSPNEDSFKAFLYDLTRCETLQGNRQVSISVCHILPVDTFRSTDDALGVIEGVLSSRQVREQHIPFWEVDADAVAAVRRESDIESAMRECIPGATGFALFCQPIYRCDSGSFESGELLLRFSTPELGNVSPGEFIPVAEHNALSSELDRMVVDLAFRAIAAGRFAASGFHHVQINLSAATVIDSEAVDAILLSAMETGVDPSFVIFEVTETTADCSKELMRRNIERLCERGFHFALDDFGTGFANIDRLSALPISMIKLDRTMLNFSPDIFRGIVGVFRTLPVELVAEGVETEEQSRFVEGAGIRQIQGFRYARPLPLGELDGFLRDALALAGKAENESPA